MALKARSEALRLKEEEYKASQRHRRILRQEVELLIGSAFFIVLVFLVGFGLGAFAGVNIPDGAACSQGNAPCHWFRFRYPKVYL